MFDTIQCHLSFTLPNICLYRAACVFPFPGFQRAPPHFPLLEVCSFHPFCKKGGKPSPPSLSPCPLSRVPSAVSPELCPKPREAEAGAEGRAEGRAVGTLPEPSPRARPTEPHQKAGMNLNTLFQQIQFTEKQAREKRSFIQQGQPHPEGPRHSRRMSPTEVS